MARCAQTVTVIQRKNIRAILVKTSQGYFCVDPEDQFVSKALIEKGSYGLGEIQLASAHIQQESRVLVVGAHIGTIAIPLSTVCRDVVAVEANPETYELLELNVLLNKRENVETIQAAANDTSGSIEFVISTKNSGGSKRMPKFRDIAYFYDNPKVVNVPAERMDDILEQSFDLVFIDIEGSEYHAFLGMQRILSQAKTLIVEFLPHHLSRVAGITVDDFVAPLAPHFELLEILSRGEIVGRDNFRNVLQHMYDNNQGDACLVFRKGGENKLDHWT
jgi:FkbM family methyltransferase